MMFCVFGAGCVLVALAVLGIVDAFMPDDDFWIRHERHIPETSHDTPLVDWGRAAGGDNGE